MNKISFENNAVYSVAELAAILGVDKHEIYNWIEDGLLESIRMPRIKIRGSWVDDFLESNKGKCLPRNNHKEEKNDDRITI